MFASLLLAASTALAQGYNRIPTTIDEARTALRGNVHPLAQARFDTGKVAGSFPLQRITLFFNRTAAQEADLDNLLREQMDPSSPNYHKWLTPEQYADRFGASEGDLARTADWLQAQGFTIVEKARGRQYIAFSGTAAQVQAAFGTEIHNYVVNGEAHFANAAEPSLPHALTNVVLGIRGLHDFRPKPRGIRSAQPRFTSSISGSHYLTPDDFATIYHLKPLYDAGIDGTGQWLAVMGQTAIPLSDIATFRSLSGLSANPPFVQQIPGANTGISTSDIGEADLDVEWAGAVARNATVIYVNAGTAANMSVFDSLTYTVNFPISPNGQPAQFVPVISISYGLCENSTTPNGWPIAELNSINTVLQQANLQGQTVVGPGGDTGAADCEDPTAPTAIHGLAVDFPASSPYVTGVGGTQFNEGANASQFWSTANNSSNGSALSYIPELVWNETVAAGSLAAGGGGASAIFPKPPWQTALTPADGARDVPDISLAAAFIHDGYLICASQQTPADCTNGFRDSGTFLDAIGGTSAGTPSFAGMVALLNQALKNQGQPTPVGNVNPLLYGLVVAGSTDAFHDITAVDNKVPCQSGSPGCPSGVPIGFTAGLGYDLASGLGSVDAYNLITELSTGTTSTPAPPDFTISSTTQSLTVTHGTSQPVMVSLQGMNGFNGTITFSCIVPTSLAGVTCTPPSAMSPPGNPSFMITASATAKLAPRPGASPTFFAWTGGGTALIAGFLLVGRDDRKRWSTKKKTALAATFIAMLLLVAMLAGCGGSSGSNVTPPPPPPPPVPESGTIVLQGKSNADIHIVPVTVNVN
ncbi:MAG: S53 family peptidase [Acidobacteriia bacterium]|nr:S53 family peptidase [Terriglobia bacterium]